MENKEVEERKEEEKGEGRGRDKRMVRGEEKERRGREMRRGG